MQRDTTPSLTLYKQILENLTQSVILLDPELTLEYINPAGEMLFGISARRIMGTDIEKLLPANSELLKLLKSGLRSNHSFTQHEVSVTLPGHRALTLDCTINPINLDVDRKRTLLLVELQQIDRQIRISREEQQLAQQQTIRTLVRGLAHEIKNPLGGLRGAAQLLERELPDDSLKEFTNIIIGEADRLRNLVNRMLGPNALPQKELINIHQVLEHVRQLMCADIQGEISFVTDYDPSIPEMLVDRDQLIQAVLNIVGNAVQAIGSKGEIILRTRTLRQFTIGQTRHKLVCEVSIIDNGPGIPEDMVESIFYPMVTGRAEGTGLGLSIAQSLINQHGGLVQCESRPGRTSFNLLLPLETTDSSPTEEPTPLRHSA